MTRIRADNPHATTPFNGAAVLAYLFNGSFDLHGGLVAPGYPGTPSIWIELECHTVTDKDFDSMQTHFAGQVCKNTLSAFKLDAKKSIRKRLINDAFDNLGFSHISLREEQ